MKIGTAKRRGAGGRGDGNGRENERCVGDGLVSARNLGSVSFKGYEKYGVGMVVVVVVRGEIANGQQIPWKVRREQRGGRDREREKGWSAAGGRSGARPGTGRWST